MPHGLRPLGLLALLGAVGCTSADKTIPPPRLQLPPPQLEPAAATKASVPASHVPDNRTAPKPLLPIQQPPADQPNPNQLPAFGPPPVGGNPAVMPLMPNDAKPVGRGSPVVPGSLGGPDIPSPAPPPLPGSAPTDVPPLPTPQPPK